MHLSRELLRMMSICVLSIIRALEDVDVIVI